ncbi:hypothetical protein KUTeg_002122 [Tegillarca granosa]|uniref:Uncharacterized protein n=1 Tax=Tegillarca granosa TaxID=220873 RepID=A0ABQ9FXR5_TEGGR|nr:hypothetical protein KUTeg_002122 [Tegillarca granosa]
MLPRLLLLFLIFGAGAVTEEDKYETTNRLREHILHAKEERDTLNLCVKNARDTYNSPDDQKAVQYTFDFIQNVCILHNSRQMSPLYFLSHRKIHIFGVQLDGEPKQLYCHQRGRDNMAERFKYTWTGFSYFNGRLGIGKS